MLTFSFFQPLTSGGNFLFNVKPDEYTQTIEANGGFSAASLTLNTDKKTIESWIENGLGRNFTVYNESQDVIFNGFVNEVVANLGTFTYKIGKLKDIANRVKLRYSAFVNTYSVRKGTDYNDNLNSQSDFGIWTKIINSGGIAEGVADDLRDTYLNEYSNPDTSQQINISGGNGPSVTINILGYYHFLNYPYNSSISGTENASDKIKNIIADNPNISFINYNVDDISTNILQVSSYESNYNIAYPLIKSITANGDASNNRWLFGVYDNLRAVYNQAPNEIFYQQRLITSDNSIYNSSNQEIKPWNVRPGKWLFISDFQTGKIMPNDLRLDSRNIFIESVTYTMPYQLKISGGKSDKLSQQIGKLGLSGIG